MNAAITKAHLTDLYRLGYGHGWRTGKAKPWRTTQAALRLEVQLTDGNREDRAWALGELRGYRNALELWESPSHVLAEQIHPGMP